jgi:hypothetical protein
MRSYLGKVQDAISGKKENNVSLLDEHLLNGFSSDFATGNF